MKKKVVIAMSGGVDSSVAALLLKQKGYDVIGIAMRLHAPLPEHGKNCCGDINLEDARKVAGILDIPFYIADMSGVFKDRVIGYFIDEYRNARTPNPCIVCNEKIKFDALLERSFQLGAGYLATGHYARIRRLRSAGREAAYALRKGICRDRDQSYFLFALKQSQLAHLIFPLGGYDKNEVRRIARQAGLPVHDKVQSQEICFINEDYRDYMIENAPFGDCRWASKGPMLDTAGHIIGEHKGTAFYTIGQRRGIGAHKEPYFVTKIDSVHNTITIGKEKDLYGTEFVVDGINWICPPPSVRPIRATVKIRHRHPGARASLFLMKNGRVKAVLDRPQRAITPGQAAVFYNGGNVLGGGWIR